MDDLKSFLANEGLELKTSYNIFEIKKEGPWRLQFNFALTNNEGEEVLTEQIVSLLTDWEGEVLTEAEQYKMIRYKSWNILSCLMKEKERKKSRVEKFLHGE